MTDEMCEQRGTRPSQSKQDSFDTLSFDYYFNSELINVCPAPFVRSSCPSSMSLFIYICELESGNARTMDLSRIDLPQMDDGPGTARAHGERGVES